MFGGPYNFIIYEEKLHMFNQALRKTREDYFSGIIADSSNSRVLFSTVNRLRTPPMSLPLELISTAKCNEFARFFNDKVQCIKNAIAITAPMPALHPDTRHSKLTHFTSRHQKSSCRDYFRPEFQHVLFGRIAHKIFKVRSK